MEDIDPHFVAAISSEGVNPPETRTAEHQLSDDQVPRLDSVLITSKPKRKRARKHVSLAIEVAGLLALIIYTIFSILQWQQIRWTNRLTRQALDSSNATLQQTLKKMQEQTDATNRLYSEAQKQTMEAQKQTGSAATIAVNSGIQASASQQSSEAAKSAADTANQTLHLSERAYLTVAQAAISLDTGIIELQVTNSGHLPSQDTRVAYTELTQICEERTPGCPSGKYKLVQPYAKSDRLPPVSAAAPGKVLVRINSFDKSLFTLDEQFFTVSGDVLYEDGFENSGTHISPYCFQFVWLSGATAATQTNCRDLTPRGPHKKDYN